MAASRRLPAFSSRSLGRARSTSEIGMPLSSLFDRFFCVLVRVSAIFLVTERERLENQHLEGVPEADHCGWLIFQGAVQYLFR
jgi:hypothetical protein